jgi:hypothetical protein
MCFQTTPNWYTEGVVGLHLNFGLLSWIVSMFTLSMLPSNIPVSEEMAHKLLD